MQRPRRCRVGLCRGLGCSVLQHSCEVAHVVSAGGWAPGGGITSTFVRLLQVFRVFEMTRG